MEPEGTFARTETAETFHEETQRGCTRNQKRRPGERLGIGEESTAVTRWGSPERIALEREAVSVVWDKSGVKCHTNNWEKQQGGQVTGDRTRMGLGSGLPAARVLGWGQTPRSVTAPRTGPISLLLNLSLAWRPTLAHHMWQK